MTKGFGQRKCIHCGVEFYGSVATKFCDIACRLKHHSKANDSDCWVWQKRCYEDGYGQTQWNGKYVRAHRASFQVFVGPIPKGKLVCHKCDNPACLNPDHLLLGTPAENSADMASKGRSLQGERHHKAKLTEAQVKAIRADSRSGKLIGRDYGVSDTMVYMIKTRKSWAHVE